MPIRKDISALPSGNPPDRTPRFGPQLAEALLSRHRAPRPKAMPERWFRASQAGKCTRSIALAMADCPETNPADLPGQWAMWIGKMIHAALDEVVGEVFPGAVVEEAVDLIDHLDGSATLDLLVTTADGLRVLVEVKTMGGYKYKMVATSFKGPPAGPPLGAVLQASIAGVALDVDEVVVLAYATENVSAWQAEKDQLSTEGRFTSEWTLDRATYREIAAPEIARLNWLRSKVGDLDTSDPVRFAAEIPRVTLNDDGDPVFVTDPTKGAGELRAADGMVLDFASVWECDYCRFRDTCIEAG